jgi:large subunit ribosomal protein L25
MDRPILKASARTKIDRGGKIPAVIYGSGVKNSSIEVDRKEFLKVYEEAGDSSLVDLNLSLGKKKESSTVLIHELQRDAVSDQIDHIDFLAVNMKKSVRTEVRLDFVGDSPAVAEGGVLVKNMSNVEVEALPGDLPKSIEVDIEVLLEIGSSLKVSDIKMPDGVTLLSLLEQRVVSVVEPRISDESEAEVEAPEDEEVEGEEGEDSEGGGEEGEAEGEENKEETSEES